MIVSLRFDTQELTSLMENFYTLTGIRIVLFDEKYNEIFAYPKECLPFCFHMRQDPKFYALCCESDKTSFELCKKTDKLPIMNNGSIIGYIMFGQVSGNKEKDDFRKNLLELSKKYEHFNEDLIKKVKFKSEKQLIAASKIIETFTSYILLKEIIRPSRNELFSAIDEYITENLSEDISVSTLCQKFYISRTQLYSLCKRYIPMGVASYIKTKRLSKAKELLQTTNMSVCDISNAVGFSDYNYFLKSFKKHFGVQTKNIRKNR